MPPTLSVVIPAYEAAGFLAEALASVQGQWYRPTEVIVVDDGSSDDTAHISRSAGVIVEVHPERRGPSAARNTGIRRAHGDLVAFLDADDVWDPNHCGHVVEAFHRHPAAVLAWSGCRFVAGEPLTMWPPVPVDTPFDGRDILLEGNVVVQSTAVVRRAALLAVGGYDERVRWAEDYDLWLRLAELGPFVRVRAITGHRRIHAAQATHGNAARLLEGSWHARHAALGRRVDAATRRRARPLLRRAWRRDVREAEWANDAEATATLVRIARETGLDATPRWWWTLRRMLRTVLKVMRDRIRQRAAPRGA